MRSESHGPGRDFALGWAFTIAAAIPTLAYILAASLAPAMLGRPVSPATPISIGLVLGLGLVVVLVVLALVYTRRLNRRDRAASALERPAP